MSFLFLEVLIALALILSLGLLTLDQAIQLKILLHQIFQDFQNTLSDLNHA